MYNLYLGSGFIRFDALYIFGKTKGIWRRIAWLVSWLAGVFGTTEKRENTEFIGTDTGT